jgi:hypothetical protein
MGMLTRRTVQVGEVQDVSRATDWSARGAEAGLTLLKGGSESRDGESEDGGEEHVYGLEVKVFDLSEVVGSVIVGSCR